MSGTSRQEQLLQALISYRGWARPMDVGGTDGSHHSKTLAALWRQGLVERRPRQTLVNHLTQATEVRASSYEYRARTCVSDLPT